MTTQDPVAEGSENATQQASPVNFGPPATALGEASACMVWNWPALVLVQQMPSSGNPDAWEPPFLLAPNQGGLDFLETLDEIKGMWLVGTTPEGLLRAESVNCVCHWRLYPDEKTHLTALMCESGAIFVADSEGAYEVDEVTRKWFVQGKFKTARRLQDACAINAVVTAGVNQAGEVKVRSEDGREYAITRHTIGVTPETLQLGMRVECLVTSLRRVLGASILPQSFYAAAS